MAHSIHSNDIMLPDLAQSQNIKPEITLVCVSSTLETLGQFFERNGQLLSNNNRVEALPALDSGKGLLYDYSQAYNTANGNIIVYTHDDVDILSPSWDTKLKQLMTKCDVFGVAGTSEFDLDAGYWWFPGTFPSAHLHGYVKHTADNQQWVTTYGEIPHYCVAIDGVFMAFKRSVFDSGKVTFDSDYFDGYHYYDMDLCMQAIDASCSLLVDEFPILHRSVGALSSEWSTYRDKFKSKWQNHKFSETMQKGSCIYARCDYNA